MRSSDLLSSSAMRLGCLASLLLTSVLACSSSSNNVAPPVPSVARTDRPGLPTPTGTSPTPSARVAQRCPLGAAGGGFYDYFGEGDCPLLPAAAPPH